MLVAGKGQNTWKAAAYCHESLKKYLPQIQKIKILIL